jgi:beta-glucosidase/6-phospho-beta-glucosidase/beta-galactosidase
VSGRFESRRQRIPIYVTENGCDAPGEATKPLEDVLHDSFRYVYFCAAVLYVRS